jgi:hypothetical protein
VEREGAMADIVHFVRLRPIGAHLSQDRHPSKPLPILSSATLCNKKTQQTIQLKKEN